MRNDITTYPLSWHPTAGGKLSPIVFRDDITEPLGPDPTGNRLKQIKAKILAGKYYPENVIRFTPTETPLTVSTRIHQSTPIIPGISWLRATGVAEIFVVEETENSIHIGYVTTTRHHGRGIWQAKIFRLDNNELQIRVWSIAMPNSALFWLGLPWARFLQLRARNKAIQQFRNL